MVQCANAARVTDLSSRGRVIVFSLPFAQALGSVPKWSPPLFPFCCQPNRILLRRPASPSIAGPSPVFAQQPNCVTQCDRATSSPLAVRLLGEKQLQSNAPLCVGTNGVPGPPTCLPDANTPKLYALVLAVLLPP